MYHSWMPDYRYDPEGRKRQEQAHDIGVGVFAGVGALLVGGAITAAIIYMIKRRKRFESAAEQECLLCNSQSLVTKGSDEYYSCKSCGYDTDLTDRAEARPFVQQLSGIKLAREGLQVATARLRDPTPDVGDGWEARNGLGAAFESAAADAEHAFERLLQLRTAMPEIWGVSPTPVEQATRTLLTKEGVAVIVLRIRAGNEHIPMMGILDRWISYLSQLEGQLKERLRTFLPGKAR